jgi:hypothetical protein
MRSTRLGGTPPLGLPNRFSRLEKICGPAFEGRPQICVEDRGTGVRFEKVGVGVGDVPKRSAGRCGGQLEAARTETRSVFAGPLANKSSLDCAGT